MHKSEESTSKNHTDNIILSGAGFSKDFGGLLASEIWSYLFNNASISKELSEKLKEHPDNYEKIYTSLSARLKDEYNREVEKIFSLMDKNLVHDNQKKNIGCLENIIKLLMKTEEKPSYFFTLNQDLLVERYFVSIRKNETALKPGDTPHGKCDEIDLYHPFCDYDLTKIIRNLYNGYAQEIRYYEYENFQAKVCFKENKTPKKNRVNYIKLHGSYNWKTKDGGYQIAATGQEKEEIIKNSDLLSSYMNLFEKSLSKKVNLICIGYGFTDEHINKVIMNSIKKYKSNIYIILPSTFSEFMKNIPNKPRSFKKIIKKGLKSYCPIKLVNLINYSNSDQKEYLEYLYKNLLDQMNANI